MPLYTVDIVEEVHYCLSVEAEDEEEAETDGLDKFLSEPDRDKLYFCEVRERNVNARLP